jgi:predicted AAA+ superfamily ATPase
VGARQVGKSTLVRSLVRERAGVVECNLDVALQLSGARSDPTRFVRHDGFMTIDEVQRTLPDALVGRMETLELWPFSQGEIEQRREDFAPLRHLARLAGERFHFGVVLHAGRAAVPFGPRLVAAPMANLWARAARGRSGR